MISSATQPTERISPSSEWFQNLFFPFIRRLNPSPHCCNRDSPRMALTQSPGSRPVDTSACGFRHCVGPLLRTIEMEGGTYRSGSGSYELRLNTRGHMRFSRAFPGTERVELKTRGYQLRMTWAGKTPTELGLQVPLTPYILSGQLMHLSIFKHINDL